MRLFIKIGIKSSQRNNTLYKVGGVIFPNKDRYVDFKGMDDGADIFISDLRNEDNIIAFFNRIKPIEVIETYPEAREEMYGLFSNITRYLCYEAIEILHLQYNFAIMFFSKFKYREQ